MVGEAAGSPRGSRFRQAFAVVIVALGSSQLVANCRPKAPAPSTRAETTESLESLRNEVLGLVGEPTCSSSNQCRSIAFGSKPCGGPWSYVAYSTQTTDSAKLAAAVAEYNAREDRLNRELGTVSDCRFVTPPKLACVASHCSAER